MPASIRRCLCGSQAISRETRGFADRPRGRGALVNQAGTANGQGFETTHQPKSAGPPGIHECPTLQTESCCDGIRTASASFRRGVKTS